MSDPPPALSLAARGLGFLARVGGMIVAPRPTIRHALTHERGGLFDIAVLVIIQTLAVQLPQVARAAWTVYDGNVSNGATVIVQTLGRGLMLPLGAAFGGAIVLRVLGGRAMFTRLVDVAALCAIPAVAVQLVGAIAALYRWAPRDGLHQVNLAVGGVWFALLLLAAVGPTRAAVLPSEDEH